MNETRTTECDRRSWLELLMTALRLASRDDAGQEIVEAAFVLPILFLILLAIFWFGRAFNINSTLDRAERRGYHRKSTVLRNVR